MRTDIGHFAIGYGDKEYELYPTFKNMRKICEPSEMPDFFSRLFGREAEFFIQQASKVNSVTASTVGKRLIQRGINRIYEDAAHVIQCCCDDYTGKLTGFVSYEKGRKAWRLGVMNIENVLHIARALMVHGVVGKQTAKSESKGESTSSIDVYAYVENAVNHLNMSIEAAESLTKTEYDRYIDNKYPDAKRKGKAPTLDEHDKAMAWLDEVNARREAAKRAN
jgi:hypothetical protein